MIAPIDRIMPHLVLDENGCWLWPRARCSGGYGRIVAAEEALIDVGALGDLETQVLQGELEVTLLLSHGEVKQAATNEPEK